MRLMRNFGGNQTWRARTYRPASEAEVLEILERHAAGRIRPLGAGHSWSDIAVCSDVCLDMSAFDQVRLYERDGRVLVRVGAGCRLQRLLDRLHAMSDRTLPTLGVIKQQTVAGAISTGTHGSGMQSLSHFVAGVRLAAYDPDTGKASVFEYVGGDELRAARCALGCAGVLLAVDLVTVPKYMVQEVVARETSIERVLGRYDEHPLTFAGLVPFAWEYIVFERKPLQQSRASPAERGKALLLRVYNTVWVDILVHFGIKASIVLGDAVAKASVRMTPRLLLMGVTRVDQAEHVITMGHHYFRHEEMELFVPQSLLAEAVEVLRYATEVYAGERGEASARLKARLEEHGLHHELLAARGSYTQHYPFSLRRLLAEDALVSMGSSVSEPLFSISVFNYQTPQARKPYYAYCSWLARCMHALFGARLHWGKHFPLGADAVARSYPRLESFKAICRATDPRGVFRNEYTARLLELP